MQPVDDSQVVALTIAGSDSSGGAGLQADLKTFAALGVYGASVVTALTAQNTLGVQGVSAVDADFVGQQLDSVLSDLRVVALKTGMLATAAVVRTVVERLAARPDLAVVVDPVMVATSGDMLLAPDAVEVIRAVLLPRATLITPNIAEAGRLLFEPEVVDREGLIRQARALVALGCPAVLLKGGHATDAEVVDVLCDGPEVILFRHPRIVTANTHGTGCTLSAAITARLALGVPLRVAVGDGIDFLCAALMAGADLVTGAGHGPVDHLFAQRRRGL